MKKSTLRFLSAVGSILDIYPQTDYEALPGGGRSDIEALLADARCISKDFDKVFEAYDATTRSYGTRDKEVSCARV